MGVPYEYARKTVQREKSRQLHDAPACPIIPLQQLHDEFLVAYTAFAHLYRRRKQHRPGRKMSRKQEVGKTPQEP